jgi:hypothetical protein
MSRWRLTPNTNDAKVQGMLIPRSAMLRGREDSEGERILRGREDSERERGF